MKKTIINLILVVIAFTIYFLQSNFFSWFNIAGIMPNLFVVLILFIGLFASRNMGTIYGIVIGLFLDFIFGYKVGIYAFGLGTIGFLAAVFDKNFSKDSRMTIMVMVLVATVIFETFCILCNYLFIGINTEIVNFINILLIEIVFNLLITIIIYPLLQTFGYYMENEYKGNKILTRYF